MTAQVPDWRSVDGSHEWTHYAVAHSPDTLRLFVDGQQVRAEPLSLTSKHTEHSLNKLDFYHVEDPVAVISTRISGYAGWASPFVGVEQKERNLRFNFVLF